MQFETLSVSGKDDIRLKADLTEFQMWLVAMFTNCTFKECFQWRVPALLAQDLMKLFSLHGENSPAPPPPIIVLITLE